MEPDKFQNVTTILFDLDNTLINTKGADRIACEKVFQYLLTDSVRKSAARSSVDKFYDLIRQSPTDPSDPEGDPDPWRLHLWKRALGPSLSCRAPSCYALWKEARTLRLLPGTEDLLFDLRKRYKLGLVTNGSSRCQWDKIHRVQCAGLFDVIVVSGDVGLEKPCAGIFEEAFRRLDACALECAMVGDRLDTDIAGALNANCACTVWVCPEEGEGAKEPWVPDFVIRDLRELPDLIPERKGFSSLCHERNLGMFHSLRDDDGWCVG